MQTRAQLNQAIKHYRLQCAQEIFRNLGYLEDEHAVELSEQYALRILINWLATKCGFAACASDIRQDKYAGLTSLESGFFKKDVYPLQSHLDSKRDLALRDFGFALLEKSLPQRLDLIGDLYQQILRAPLSINERRQPEIRFSKTRRTTAEFYTPPWVVSYCFRQAGCDWKTVKILDPSCGSGNFLLGALAESQLKGKDAQRLARHQLHGRDIDARAVSLCRLSLFLATAGCRENAKSPASQISQLEDLASALTANIRVADQTLCSAVAEFDVVATNPPYVSYGSRGQLKIVSSQAALLRAFYPQSSEYKIRLHSVFQDICLRWTKPGGQVLLLLPDAFLTGSFYKKLRHLITSTAEIVQIAELPADTISDATVGNWCIAHYKKKPDQEIVQANPVTVSRVNALGEAIAETKVPFEIFVSRDCLRFNVITSDEDAALIRHLDQFPVLGEVLHGHTGIRSRQGQKAIVAEENLAGQYKRGLVSGAQVLPFQTTWQGHWLNVQRDLLFPGGFDPAIVEQPKLLLRQTADRIISACDRESFYHLNNIHSFAPRAGTDSDGLDAYAAILNSRFFSYVYRLRSREKDRALAQIDIDMVESMPLPSLQTQAKLLSRAGKALQISRDDAKLHGQLQKALERLVFDLFHIPNAIARYLGSTDLPASSQARELILSVETNNLPYYSMNNY